MKKRYGIILVVALFCSFLPLVQAESQATLGDLKNAYQSKLNEKAENDRKSEEAKAEIEANRRAIAQAEADISKAEEDMEEAQAKINESNAKIAELQERASKVFRYLQQMQGENAYVEYVSGATTVTDLVTRIAALEQLSDYIKKTIMDLEEEVKRNEELKKDLEVKKATLERQSKEYAAVIAARVADVANYDKYALSIDDQVKATKARLDDAVERCKKWAPDKGDSAIVNVDCIEPKYQNSIINDGWLKPLNYGVVLSQVGARWGSYHNALDISGSSPFEGTPVYAAAAGVVAATIPRTSCGGNMLFIDVNVNGQSYLTYYYHLLNFNVKVGDVVTQDTVIGWVGGYSTSTSHGGYDSCTTGAHLHFGVAKGNWDKYHSSPQYDVIVPPGFPNTYGWRFYSRTDMYRG
ncbi:MAG: peptidoglycan DD-metalloendopeptidase family protein [Bacilli bacterium]|nr:peptidoglycan DD-metalloendopeptidase family protein [Bacilli bacterium]